MSAAWETALARYEAADAEMRSAGDRLSTLYDAADAKCPRRDEFFRRYELRLATSRDINFRAAQMAIVIERAKGRHLTGEEAEQTSADANRIVDEFEEWSARHEEAFRDYDKHEKLHDALVMERWNAFQALITTQAPDEAALLVKIEMLARDMEASAVEDAERMGAVRDDARRLLGRA